MTPKLILLTGFAGGGKSTLANKYIDNHPLAINIEGDKIMTMIGQWKTNYEDARKTIFPLTKALAKTYLALGYDVVIPYLLTNTKDAEEFEKIAKESNAEFIEIYLETEKSEAVDRLIKRGTWGEEGLPPLTEKDLPEINSLYDSMEQATNLRGSTTKIEVLFGNIEKTYTDLINRLEQ